METDKDKSVKYSPEELLTSEIWYVEFMQV